jgi:hypothetical protein
MIVYGFRSRNKVLGQTQYGCKQCQRNAYHGVVRSRRFFTLFWIPIFPVGTTTIARCQLCGYQEKVDNKRAEEMFAHQQMAQRG